MTDMLSTWRRGITITIAVPDQRPAAVLTLAVVIIALFLIPVPASGWEYSEFSLDAGARIAMMATAGEWNPYLEIRGVFHGAESEFRYNSLTTGTYFRAAPWLKVGAFYRLQGGARHLEDWTVIDNPSPTPDEQYWEDVSPWRYENLLLLDATPRFLLPWMPGGDWVGAVKVRYEYNFYNNNQSLLTRPGITWVLMRDREPVLNLSLQIPLYFALNYNDRPLYGFGTYVIGLWHLEEQVKLEGRVSWFVKNYEKFAFGGPWILHSHHLVLGIGVIFTPDFSR